MVKAWWILAGAVLIITISIFLCVLMTTSNPARQPDNAIRAQLLDFTPLGASGDEVHQFVMGRFDGQILHKGVESGWANKSISAIYGSYRTFSDFPWVTIVEVSWHFDENGKLKTLSVSRGVDTL